MKTFAAIVQNLAYVTVNRAEARGHWLTMCEGVTRLREEPEHLASCFLQANSNMLLKNKAVAGLLSHKKSRGFLIHRIRERAINRRLT